MYIHNTMNDANTTRSPFAVAGASTPEADKAFAAYVAKRDAAPRKTMREMLIDQLGEELARERFPHRF